MFEGQSWCKDKKFQLFPENNDDPSPSPSSYVSLHCLSTSAPPFGTYKNLFDLFHLILEIYHTRILKDNHIIIFTKLKSLPKCAHTTTSSTLAAAFRPASGPTARPSPTAKAAMIATVRRRGCFARIAMIARRRLMRCTSDEESVWLKDGFKGKKKGVKE